MLKIQSIFCNALAMMMGMCTWGQTSGEIHGKVVDAQGQPLTGVIVTADNGGALMGDASDLDGKFRIKPLEGGVYQVMYAFMGFDTLIVNNVSVLPDQITKLDEQTLTIGPEVVVFDHLVPLINYDADHIQTLTGEELKNLASANGGNVNNILKSQYSDIKASPDGEELYFRGSRAGSVLYFLDGMKIRDNNVTVPSSGISTLSVYTGGLPAKYGDTTGGVVVIQTKNYLQELYKKQSQ
jgi:Carboxypeptidase regulatory-like domain/TonB-dependent Receptor Plug Domain